MSDSGSGQLLERMLNSYIPVQDLEIDLNELLMAQGSGKSLEVVTKTLETPQGEIEAVTLEPKFVPKDNPMSVYFMDQLFFDSEFFNQDAWRHALRYFKKVKPDAIVFSGALLRIDRPEYKIDALTSFDLTEDDFHYFARNGGMLHDPLMDYMNAEFKIARKRFSELRRAAPAPDSDIYYIWSTDDGFSVNRIVHYLALRFKEELRSDVRRLRKELKDYESGVKKQEEKLEGLSERAKKTRARTEKKIDDLESRLRDVEEEISSFEEEQQYVRPRKESPVHQMLVREGTELVMGMYEDICNKYGITLLVGESVIDVNGNKLKVSENARAFDSPIKNRPGELTKSISGQVDELAEKGILAVVEGHQGTYWFSRFDTAPSEDEVNKELEGLFYPPKDSYQDSVYAAILPVFQDQEKVKEFIEGKRPERLSARKAVGNRNHFALKMFNNGGVSGLFGLVVDEEGRVGRDIIPYSAFKSKKSLSPKIWWEFEIQGDMHLLNPYTCMELVHGVRERLLRHLDDNTQRIFMGKPVRVAAQFDLGDDIEGNTSGWPGAGAEARRSHPFDVMRQIMQMAVSQPKDIDEMLENAAWVLGFNLEGPRENMGDLLGMLADYYLPGIEALAQKSPFKTVFVGVGSNHSYLTLRRAGVNPHEILMWHTKRTENLSDRVLFDERDARSNMVALTLGQSVEGDYLFPPLKTIIVHDAPSQGDATQSLTRFGPKFDAELEFGGHMHVSKESAGRYRGKPNEISLASSVAAFQKFTSTEGYKPGEPRHKGSKTLYISGGEVDTGQRFIFENTAPLLAHESQRSMRLGLKEIMFMNQYQPAA